MFQAKFLIFLVLWNVHNDSVSGAADDLTISYSERQNIGTVRTLANRVVHFESGFARRLQVLSYYPELLERKITEMDNKLNAWELLNSVCVRKYRGEAPQLVEVAPKFKQCLQKSKNQFGPLTLPVEGTVRQLENFYYGPFLSSLRQCETQFHSLSVNRSLCYLDEMEKSHDTAITYMNTFENEMLEANSKADTIIREAFSCVTQILTENLGSISKVLTLANHCIFGAPGCTKCKENIELEQALCPLTALNLGPNPTHSHAIDNPFKYISSDLSCMEIYFVQ